MEDRDCVQWECALLEEAAAATICMPLTNNAVVSLDALLKVSTHCASNVPISCGMDGDNEDWGDPCSALVALETQMPLLAHVVHAYDGIMPIWALGLLKRWVDVAKHYLQRLHELYPGFDPTKPPRPRGEDDYFCTGGHYIC